MSIGTAICGYRIGYRFGTKKNDRLAIYDTEAACAKALIFGLAAGAAVGQCGQIIIRYTCQFKKRPSILSIISVTAAMTTGAWANGYYDGRAYRLKDAKI